MGSVGDSHLSVTAESVPFYKAIARVGISVRVMDKVSVSFCCIVCVSNLRFVPACSICII